MIYINNFILFNWISFLLFLFSSITLFKNTQWNINNLNVWVIFTEYWANHVINIRLTIIYSDWLCLVFNASVRLINAKKYSFQARFIIVIGNGTSRQFNIIRKKCIFVKYSTLASSWHVMLQSAHNTECQYFEGNKLGDLKYWKIMRNGQSMNESNFSR